MQQLHGELYARRRQAYARALASTRKACPGQDVMQQEQEFLAALQAVATWSIRDDRLDLRRGDGAGAVTARMAPAAHPD